MSLQAPVQSLPGFDTLFQIDTTGTTSVKREREDSGFQTAQIELPSSEPAPKRRLMVVRRTPQGDGMDLTSSRGEAHPALAAEEPPEEGEIRPYGRTSISLSRVAEIERAININMVGPPRNGPSFDAFQIELMVEYIICGVEHLSDFEGASILFTDRHRLDTEVQVGIATRSRTQFNLILRSENGPVVLMLTDHQTGLSIYKTERHPFQLTDGFLAINKIAARIWFEFKKRLEHLAPPRK